MPLVPADALGPFALTVVLLVVGAYVGRFALKFFWNLWELHVAGDTKRDAALEILTATVPGMAKSLEQLSAVVESWSEKKA